MASKRVKVVVHGTVQGVYFRDYAKAEALKLGLSGWVKNLIDRAGFVSRMNDHMFFRKVGAPVIAVRRGGAVQVYNEIMSFFAINHFYMVGSSYWNFAFGLAPGEASQDEEGMETMDDLAANMGHLLKALKQ